MQFTGVPQVSNNFDDPFGFVSETTNQPLIPIPPPRVSLQQQKPQHPPKPAFNKDLFLLGDPGTPSPPPPLPPKQQQQQLRPLNLNFDSKTDLDLLGSPGDAPPPPPPLPPSSSKVKFN